jgi:hypothetical protein
MPAPFSTYSAREGKVFRNDIYMPLDLAIRMHSIFDGNEWSQPIADELCAAISEARAYQESDAA